MGINAFVAFGVVAGMGYTPQAALGAVLVAGILFLIISLTPLRAWLINSIPKSLKLGIGAGIGLFLAIIGLEIMGVVGDHPVTLVTLGDLKNPLVLLGCLAFVAMVVLEKLKVKGNIIIGIIAFSIIAWVTGLAKFNGVVSSPPPMTYLFDFDLKAALSDIKSSLTRLSISLGKIFLAADKIGPAFSPSEREGINSKPFSNPTSSASTITLPSNLITASKLL